MTEKDVHLRQLTEMVADEAAKWLANAGLLVFDEQGSLTKAALIISVVPRDERHCHKYRTNLICRLEPVAQAAVIEFHRARCLFLRTENGDKVGTCVQIKEIELAGVRVAKDTEICRALGLEPGAYNASWDGSFVRLSPVTATYAAGPGRPGRPAPPRRQRRRGGGDAQPTLPAE